MHHAGRVGIAERRHLDDLVPRTAVARPAVTPCNELRAADAENEKRCAKRLDQEREEVERVIVGPMQVVEDEHDRAPLVGRGVGLEERFDDRTAKKMKLLLVPLDRLDQRRIQELEAEDLPEEIDDVADLSVLEDGRDLRSNLGLGGLWVHPLDDPEPRPERACEDCVRTPLIGRVAAEHPRRRVFRCATDVDQKITNEPRLTDPGRAEDRDSPSRPHAIAPPPPAPRRAHEARSRAPLQHGAAGDVGAGGERANHRRRCPRPALGDTRRTGAHSS